METGVTMFIRFQNVDLILEELRKLDLGINTQVAYAECISLPTH